ncbi:hypothetical protein L1987_79867 [Smallanthus sonchifolius]|uniref:Uncharacterized protein n=1 Tax=Smallanthus sonchifolius TaxID=185202 RepID=A0ACB8YLJ3_9ASTR|nr:hypothetical protein L1987_79867 [Smallanthus sonchifolius]
MTRSRTLKEAVRTMISEGNEMMENPLSMLNLIDDLQRLSISYHFVNEISNVLENIYRNYYKIHEEWSKMDLNLKSLGFRLLRQHGYQIPQEIFKDHENGSVKEHLNEDMISMLNLYEACYYSVEDESILDDARIFIQKYLKQNIVDDDESIVSSLVSHALDFPLHWMLPRVETKWFIEVYERRHEMNPMVLELAKLDFNIVQAVYQQDLKYASRWGLNAIKELPDYMKICFLALYNAINEMSYNVLANEGILVLPYLRKTWQDLCNSYIIEARWFNSGYTPTLNEFLDNGCMSIGIVPIIKHAYLLTLTTVSEDSLEQIQRAEILIRNACLIVRLTNDLGTSSVNFLAYLDELERGDVPKSIQCYMHESGASEVEAREYIQKLTLETWKKLNKERQAIDSAGLPHEFIECVINLARMGHFMYTDGDKHGKADMFKPYALSLFVNPILGLP